MALALNKLRDPGVEVPAISRDRLGREVLTASAPIGTLGWLVFVDLPLSEALQPVYDSLYRTIAVLAFGLAFAVLAGIWFAQRMVVPIRALAAGAARIGGGDLDHRIEVTSGDEVESLADSFNEMGSRLKESYATLEHKVELIARSELTEALEQQTATAEVLGVISSSPGELAAGIPGHAGERNAHLRAQSLAFCTGYDGKAFTCDVALSAPPAFAEGLRREPVSSNAGLRTWPLGRHKAGGRTSLTSRRACIPRSGSAVVARQPISAVPGLSWPCQMLKEDELLGAHRHLPPGSSAASPRSRSSWSRASPIRPSSPSRTFGS